jgi:hypothetical protein
MVTEERRKRVIELHNQGMDTRELAEILKMSFRDIGSILRDADKEKEAKRQGTEQGVLSSRAYKLFSEGKTNVQVAIELNLREPEVNSLCREYWNMVGLDNLNQIYREIGHNIWLLVELHRSTVAAGMKIPHVIKLLQVANNDLPSVEYRHECLKVEVDSLEKQKRSSIRILQDYSDQITALGQRFDYYCSSCQEEGTKLNGLQQKRLKLEAAVRHFENNSEEYIKIRKKVQEALINILSDPKALLTPALWSLVKSMRNNPEKFSSLIYHNTSVTSINYSGQFYGPAYVAGLQRQHQYSSEEEFMKACAYMLIEEAAKLFGNISKEFLDKIIDDSSRSGPVSSSFPSLPPPSDDE